jgi:2'-hydroxyisoflavone reductase
MKTMLEGVRKGTSANVSFTWIDNDFFKAQGVGDGQFPLYAPPTGDTAGFHRCSISRALATGLKFRPVADTAKATLEWYQSLPSNTQGLVAPQFAKNAKGESWLDQEKQLLDKWQKRGQK